MSENAKKWFRAAGRRAVKTIAQTFVAMTGTAAVMGDVNWPMVASASVLAGILSMATSVATCDVTTFHGSGIPLVFS